MDCHRITTAGISVEVSAKAAELVSLRDAAGNEMLWQAGPEWPRHAPVLFPTVGRLRDDTLRHDGKSYALGQHGFARDSQFEWTERSADRAALRLCDSAETRRSFPFAFRLELIYAVADDVLTVTTRVTNPGDGPLPCGVGAHPAFRWPLVTGISKDDHVVIFETSETGTAKSVDDGLLGMDKPLPFDGRKLKLSERLFATDALVMPGVASRKVMFSALDPRGRTRVLPQRLLGRLQGPRHLVEAGWGAVPLHRALVWHGKRRRLGWRVFGKAGHSCTRRRRDARFPVERAIRVSSNFWRREADFLEFHISLTNRGPHLMTAEKLWRNLQSSKLRAITVADAR